MKIVFFTHPDFLQHQSMPRFAKMLAEGMLNRGHQVERWTPQPKAFNIPFPRPVKKWLGYIDQYVLFPKEIQNRIKMTSPDTLFVFTDHALGPWVPLVAKRPHIIHCHDFLAQQSALHKLPENRTRWTGRKYQAFIRRGYSTGKNFISVSEKTRTDLHSFLNAAPSFSEVVYNGLNGPFSPRNPAEMRDSLFKHTGINLGNGYILHVGGNQWYKNRIGIIEIYNAWRAKYNLKIPLLLIGETPDHRLKKELGQSPFRSDINLLNRPSDELVRNAYAGATVLLFPSLAEGFGWPIAEAMASGCPIVTTFEAPMTEVAGKAGFYIPRRPLNRSSLYEWAIEAAKVVQEVISLSPSNRKAVVEEGLRNVRRFDSKIALGRIEEIYQTILSKENSHEFVACYR